MAPAIAASDCNPPPQSREIYKISEIKIAHLASVHPRNDISPTSSPGSSNGHLNRDIDQLLRGPIERKTSKPSAGNDALKKP
jgi:hypothetical protein